MLDEHVPDPNGEAIIPIPFRSQGLQATICTFEHGGIGYKVYENTFGVHLRRSSPSKSPSPTRNQRWTTRTLNLPLR
jgi:hypothetical protein